MPENVYDSLTGPPYNLTLDDFHNIAMLDPYWNKGTQPITIDKTRFTAEPFDFPYEAPLGPAPYWDCLGKTVTVTNSFTDSGTSSSSQQYSVGWDVAFGDPLHFLKLDAKGDIVWTNTVSHQNTQMDSQSASATVNCSSLAWGNNPLNPHRVNVYFDNFYGSFLFDLSDLPPADQLLSSGQVVDSSSEPARGMKLELSYANRTYHTFTDNDGNFAFYSEDGPSKALRAELSVIGPSQTITQTVSVGGTTAVALPSSFHQQPR
jgi:hypothetical protein